MFQHDLDAIRKLVPAELHAVTYIAGGAAIAPHTADDIDVWVLGDYQQEVLNHLDGPHRASIQLFPMRTDADICREKQLPPDECAEYLEWLRTEGNNVTDSGIKLVANIVPYGGTKRIQLLVATQADHIGQVLDRFDITTHQFAVGLDEQAHAFETATLPSELPRAHHTKTPVGTLKRLQKLCQRYGWDVRNHPDIPALREAARAKGDVYKFDMVQGNPAYTISDEEIPF